MKRWQYVALCAVLALAFAVPASAYPVGFGGGGPAGSDPFGHPWALDCVPSAGSSWGMPGLGCGVIGFAGPTPAEDFHIAFFGLGDFVIDMTPPTSWGGFESTTRFSNVSDELLWTTVFDSPTAVSFYAPAGTSLAPGEGFFVNVMFTGPVPPTGGFGFEAVWTGKDHVPDAASSAQLLGLGVAGLVALRRRFKA
jgi:hypothetical protein